MPSGSTSLPKKMVRLCYLTINTNLIFTTAILGWTPVHVMFAMQQVIAHASNRVFVGLPLCA